MSTRVFVILVAIIVLLVLVSLYVPIIPSNWLSR